MMILHYIVLYLMIGTVFVFLIDLLNDYLAKHSTIEYDGPNEGEWGLSEHIAAILFWPYAVFVFVTALFTKRK